MIGENRENKIRLRMRRVATFISMRRVGGKNDGRGLPTR